MKIIADTQPICPNCQATTPFYNGEFCTNCDFDNSFGHI
jgi:predicted amidophosphoribosyltransferase